MLDSPIGHFFKGFDPRRRRRRFHLHVPRKGVEVNRLFRQFFRMVEVFCIGLDGDPSRSALRVEERLKELCSVHSHLFDDGPCDLIFRRGRIILH